MPGPLASCTLYNRQCLLPVVELFLFLFLDTVPPFVRWSAGWPVILQRTCCMYGMDTSGNHSILVRLSSCSLPDSEVKDIVTDNFEL